MKTMRNLVLTVLGIAALTTTANEGVAQVKLQGSPNLAAMRTFELPRGGTTVRDPGRLRTIYYITRAWKGGIHDQVMDRDKMAGLYRSENGGNTWQWINGEHQFYELFIHPDSGELFAITVQDEPQSDRRTLRTKRLLRSADGRRWKLMSQNQAMLSGVTGIARDPDHPQRIRLSMWNFGQTIFTAVDDEYSAWTRINVPRGPIF